MLVLTNVRLLTKMGRVYIYSKQRISKGMFDDDEFRAMCHAFCEAGGGRDTAPCLRRHVLLKYVNAVEEGAQTGCLCSSVEEGAQTGRLFFAVAETLRKYDGSG